MKLPDVKEVDDLFCSVSRSLHPTADFIDTENAASDMPPKIDAEHLVYPLSQGAKNLIDSLQRWQRSFDDFPRGNVEVKVGDEVCNRAPLGLLFVKLCNSFPVSLGVEGLKALRPYHPDNVLVREPSDLSLA